GCGKKGATVTGRVTFDGDPVEAGYITFNPDDGKGTAVGAPIRGGKYKAMDVPLGRYRVNIVSGDPSRSSRDSGEEPGKGQPAAARPRPDTNLITPDAIGNNAVREVSKLTEIQDFELEKPKRDKQADPGKPRLPTGIGPPTAPPKGAPGGSGPPGGFPK